MKYINSFKLMFITHKYDKSGVLYLLSQRSWIYGKSYLKEVMFNMQELTKKDS